jgi:tripartite-type tricarboxylate transporter receptor subunit TctC
MKLPRRNFLHLTAGAAAVLVAPRVAFALDYPTRPVRILVGFPGGSSSDVGARLIGQALSERLGQQFFIENRPGAASNLATEAAARASPDGYTLLVFDTVSAINITVYNNPSLIHDFVPVASITRGPGLMVVNPKFPAKSVPEFIAYAKANPGKINMATAGSGSMLDVYGELFMMMAGVDMVRVPYRGAPPAVTDLVGGRVDVVFDTFAASIALVRAGQLRALAVTTATRSEALPDIPSLGDFLPGYDASNWKGIGAPKNTPPEIVAKLNKEISAALSDPSLKAKLAEFGNAPFATSPAEFDKFFAEEVEKWGKVVRAANIKPE